MEKKKYKILVLSDLKKSANSTLKSTVGLAKIIDGTITFFHVKKPIDILEKDNQLSAMRTITAAHKKTEKNIEDLIAPISMEYEIPIHYSFVFGNVKHEIGKHIEESKPDIIVLGRRKSKSFNMVGDYVTPFVLKAHRGVILISANKNALEPNKKIALGVFNGMEDSFNIEFAEALMAHAQQPLKSFKIVKNATILKEKDSTSTNTVEYLFEEGGNAISNLSNYLSKSNINLLCIDRERGEADAVLSDIKNAIDKFNVSLLLTGEHGHGAEPSILGAKIINKYTL